MISVEENIIPSELFFKKNYNINKVVKNIENIQNKYKVINVVGTNGKGSVSFYLSQSLKTNFEKVGLFISPAFLFHNERIQINNIPISDEDLLRLIKNNSKMFKEMKLTFFEIWTILAILYFEENQIDIAVIEAGIGGLKDSTTVFENQLAVCLTSVSIDHTEVLGDKIEDIILQKILINKNNCPLVISKDNSNHLKLIKRNFDNVFVADQIDDYVNFQSLNKGLVIKTLQALNLKMNMEVFNLEAPLGRFTVIHNDPKVIIDGCHNIGGVKSFISNIKIDKQVFIYASSKQKNHQEILDFLSKKIGYFYTINFEHEKSWDAKEFNINYVEDWKSLIKENLNNKKDIIIFGSLYFIPQVYSFFKKEV